MLLFSEFVWWMGVVEDINDPEFLGRVRVRIFGAHNDDTTLLPTNNLPWALIMQPTTSAAISGIGIAPVGLLQGSWVVGFFADGKNMQQPVVMGSIASQYGNPDNITTNTTTAAATTTSISSTTTKYPYPLDNNHIKQIKEKIGEIESRGQYNPEQYVTGALGKYQFRSGALTEVGLFKKPALNIYNDDNWLGPNSKVDAFKAIKGYKDFLEKPDVQELAMDKLLEANYNYLKNNKITRINVNDSSPENIQRIAGLLGAAHYRLESAKAMALNGIDGGDSVSRKRYESLAIAVGASGSNIPSPIFPTATLAVVSEQKSKNNNEVKTNFSGFKDPVSKYPLPSIKDDINILATANKNNYSTYIKHIQEKSDYRITGIEKTDKTSWSEPEPAYCAQYPYNQVIQTSCGHIVELDNTPGAERIHVYHKTGSYIEIDPIGSIIKKVKGTNYEIIEGENKIYVKNAHYLTIDGPTQVNIKNNATIHVEGDLNAQVRQNLTVNCAKDTNLISGGNIQVRAGNIKMTAINDFEFYGKNNNITTTNEINIFTSVYKHTANKSSFNDPQNIAKNINSNNLPSSINPGKEVAGYNPKYEIINCLHPIFEAVEDPDNDTDPSYISAVILDAGVSLTESVKEATPAPGQTGGDIVPSSGAQNTQIIFTRNQCDFTTNDSFNPGRKISELFTLGDLTTNVLLPSSREKIPDSPPRLNKLEIACNLQLLARNGLDKIKKQFPNIIITSGFRKDYEQGDPLSKRSRGQKSDHGIGKAVDIQILDNTDFNSLIDVATWMAANVPYKQIIYEYSAYSNRPHIHYAFGISDSQVEKSSVSIGTLYIDKDGIKKWLNKGNFQKFKQ